MRCDGKQEDREEPTFFIFAFPVPETEDDIFNVRAHTDTDVGCHIDIQQHTIGIFIQ